ncbi:MAG: hypothetical protein JXA66_01875 [Oligoflexia bacterium]|nr:hypothetical protein [Oligoflexia bacterium]
MRNIIILFFPLIFVSVKAYAFDTQKDESVEDGDTGIYLALLNHVYYNVDSDSNLDNTFKAMLTIIPGNDLYVTIVPSASWSWARYYDDSNIRLNDPTVTLSYGSPAGGTPTTSMYPSTNITAALTMSLPLSETSRESGLITSVWGSVSLYLIFNERRTSISLTPSFIYDLRSYQTAAPAASSLEEIPEDKTYIRDELVFEKLDPYSHYSLGAGITICHRIFEMTYVIAWFNTDFYRKYPDALEYSGNTWEITPAEWSSTFTLGQKLFFPVTGCLWGDVSVNSSGNTGSFVPYGTDDGNNLTLSAGLSYFF